MKILSMWLTAIIGLAVQSAGVAHHATTKFDTDSLITIEGEVVRYEWVNPHVYLYVEESRDSGEAVVWELEGQPPAILRRMGWSRKNLKVGDYVTVTGNPLRESNVKNGKEALLASIKKPDTSVVNVGIKEVMSELTQGDAANPQQADSLAGTWITKLNMEVVGPYMAPENFPLTEKGKKAIETFVETEDSPAIDCVANPSPLFMLAPDTKQILIEKDKVVIKGEFDAAKRTIHLNGQSVGNVEPSIQGHSVGHWEGDSLIIETTHFTPHRSGNAGGLSSGPEKRMWEKLELLPNGTQLKYSYRLEDPDYLQEPIEADNVLWAYRPDLNYEALPCDPDNAKRFID